MIMTSKSWVYGHPGWKVKLEHLYLGIYLSAESRKVIRK